MAGVDDIVLKVSQLTKVAELNAVTDAVKSRLAALPRVAVYHSDGTIPGGLIEVPTQAEQLKEMQALLDRMRSQGDEKTE